MEPESTLAFDKDWVLDAVLTLFRRSVHQGASLPELTETMEFTRPGLFALFGNNDNAISQHGYAIASNNSSNTPRRWHRSQT